MRKIRLLDIYIELKGVLIPAEGAGITKFVKRDTQNNERRTSGFSFCLLVYDSEKSLYVD